jgi:hypothetical protein
MFLQNLESLQNVKSTRRFKSELRKSVVSDKSHKKYFPFYDQNVLSELYILSFTHSGFFRCRN